MGLDVCAFKQITKLNVPCDEDGEPLDFDGNYIRLYPDGDFAERADGLVKGLYTYTDSAEGYSGGNGRYNVWREHLAALAGYPATAITQYGKTEMKHAAACWNGATGPFSELINFTDCDGVIGPVTAAKLAKDFDEFDERAKEYEREVAGFHKHYSEFKASMEMASDGGCVRFS
jgi:hypothetical protein